MSRSESGNSWSIGSSHPVPYTCRRHIDTHGAATLLYPRSDVEAGLFRSGQAIALLSVSDGFYLTVQPPIGRDLVYAIVTDAPITRADLATKSTELVVSFEHHQAPALARQLSEVLSSRPSIRWLSIQGGEPSRAHRNPSEMLE